MSTDDIKGVLDFNIDRVRKILKPIRKKYGTISNETFYNVAGQAHGYALSRSRWGVTTGTDLRPRVGEAMVLYFLENFKIKDDLANKIRQVRDYPKNGGIRYFTI